MTPANFPVPGTDGKYNIPVGCSLYNKTIEKIELFKKVNPDVEINKSILNLLIEHASDSCYGNHGPSLCIEG